MIGEPLHEGCGEAAMVDLSVADLPVPPELAPDGPADPDRSWAWRDAEAGGDVEPGADDVPGGDPDDGPIDSEASFAAWERLGIIPRFLPPLDAFGPPPKK